MSLYVLDTDVLSLHQRRKAVVVQNVLAHHSDDLAIIANSPNPAAISR